MASTSIENLFDNNRMPDGAAMVALALYFPIGVILAALRFFIGFHTFIVALVLPRVFNIRSFILRVMCGVLGILVTQEGAGNWSRKARVIVANYTSTLDHLAVELLMPNILPCVWDLPAALMWLLGYTDMGAKQGRDVLIQKAKKHAASGSTLPILVFPEGASTNGKVGLLKFSVWPFSLDKPVQPILIQLFRPPFAAVAPSVLGGRWWIDVFWFLFVPYTHFRIRVLPQQDAEDGERVEEHTRRVEQLMARELGVATTPHTSADKVEYAKRLLFIQPPPAPGRPQDDEDSPLNVMARQVKDVLPHVPMETIRKDLVLTKDVDLTITNILEGRISFTPEDSSQNASSSRPVNSRSSMPQVKTAGPRLADTAAKAFARNANDRQLSLADRKRLLLDHARQRYIKKHGLNK